MPGVFIVLFDTHARDPARLVRGFQVTMPAAVIVVHPPRDRMTGVCPLSPQVRTTCGRSENPDSSKKPNTAAFFKPPFLPAARSQ